jgi:hypothetical protein
MKGIKLAAAWFFISLFTVLALSAFGCKKASNPVESTTIPITTDVFPLTVGHKITYTGYLRQVGTDSDVTTQTYTSSWTVVSNDTATPLGGTSNLVIDSITSPAPSASLLYIQRTPPTGDANFTFMQTITLPQGDSLVWMLIGNIGYGVASFWSAFDDTVNNADSSFDLKFVGEFADQESLTVAGQTFYAYRTTFTQIIIRDGVVQGNGIGTPVATYWFAPGVGPVKMIIDATETKSGYDWEFKGKNF